MMFLGSGNCLVSSFPGYLITPRPKGWLSCAWDWIQWAWACVPVKKKLNYVRNSNMFFFFCGVFPSSSFLEMEKEWGKLIVSSHSAWKLTPLWDPSGLSLGTIIVHYIYWRSLWHFSRRIDLKNRMMNRLYYLFLELQKSALIFPPIKFKFTPILQQYLLTYI